MNRHLLPALCLCAASAIWIAQTPAPATAPAPLPKFTIGKDTTLIDGPLNPDGTINYVAAMNAIIGEGATRENNAALLLMAIKIDDFEDAKSAAAFEELRIPWPRERPERGNPRALPGEKESFRIGSPPCLRREQKKIDDLALACRTKPWKPEVHPEVADWLGQSGPALEMVEKAVQLPRYFVPFVSDKLPTAADGLPLFAGAGLWLAQCVDHPRDDAGRQWQPRCRSCRHPHREEIVPPAEPGTPGNQSPRRQCAGIRWAPRACASMANGTAPAAGSFAKIRREIAADLMPQDDPTTQRMEAMFGLSHEERTSLHPRRRSGGVGPAGVPARR